MTFVSPLQAEDGRLGGDLSEQTTASVLWDVLADQASGLTLDEIVELAALQKEDCEVVRIARARLLLPFSCSSAMQARMRSVAGGAVIYANRSRSQSSMRRICFYASQHMEFLGVHR